LAVSQIKWEEVQAEKKRKLDLAMKDAKEESTNYITPKNYRQLIDDALFTKVPTTTGIVTPFSQYWRYEVFTPKLERLLSSSFQEQLRSMSESRVRTKLDGQFRVRKRTLVEDFLNQMIGSGSDRADYEEIVKAATEYFEEQGAFDDERLEFSLESDADAKEDFAELDEEETESLETFEEEKSNKSEKKKERK
jgi:hypothetical protein